MECSRILYRHSVYDARAWERTGEIRCCCGHSVFVASSGAALIVVGAGRRHRWLVAQSVLPEGPGRDVTVKICGNCHGAETVASVRHTPEGWREVIARMVAAGAQGSEQELDTVLPVSVHPFPRRGAEAARSQHGTGHRARERGRLLRKEAAALIAHREKNGPCKKLEDLKKVAGSRLQEDRSAEEAARLHVAGRARMFCIAQQPYARRSFATHAPLLATTTPDTRTHRMLKRRLFMAAAVLLSGVGAVAATDVLMEGVDTARTGWVRDEKIFTLANVGSTKLLWRVQLNSTPRSMHNLFPPLVARERADAAGSARGRPGRGRHRRPLRDQRRRTVRCSGAAGSRTGSRIRRRSTTCSALADRPPCRRWCRHRRASTRSMPCPGTASCTRSTSATVRTSRRRRSSFPATASRMRSTTRTASSTPQRRRAAAG